MTAITFVPTLLGVNIFKKISNSLVRSGYHQSAYEMDRQGYHAEAPGLRNDAKLVGVN